MTPSNPLVSALKSAVIRVADLTAARAFYEGVLGLQVQHETDTIADKARRLWGLNGRRVRCVRLGRPGDNFGMIDLVEIENAPNESLRHPDRPFDLGWFTLNFRTNHLEKAVAACEQIGCRAVNLPTNYEAGGKPIREVLIELPSGERCTLLEVGGINDNLPLFNEAVATTGAIVPSLPASLAFYRDALGLNVAVTLDQQGEPFASMIGAPGDTRLQMALLTSGGNWTGKLEFMQLTLPPGLTQRDANAPADGYKLGYWMMSVMTNDLDQLQAACRHAGISPLRGPATIDRPCYGRVKALILRGPGGELIEVLGPANTK